MVKHTQPIHRKVPTKCFDVFNHFVGLARKGRSIDFHKMFWFLLHYRTHLFIWVKTINVKLFSNLKHFEFRVSIPFLVPLSPERVTFKVCVGGFRLIYAMLLKEISQDIFDEKKTWHFLLDAPNKELHGRLNLAVLRYFQNNHSSEHLSVATAQNI